MIKIDNLFKEKIKQIEEIGLFAYLQSLNIADLNQYVSKHTFKKGIQLYGTTDPITDVYEVISGAVKLGRLSPEGKECVYEIITPGQIFGNFDCLDDVTFSEFSRILTFTEIITYQLDFFKSLLAQYSEISYGVFAKTVARWHKTETLLYQIRSYEPRKRIILLHESMQHKINTAISREVLLNKLITNKDIADLTATTRQLVAETLKLNMVI